MEPDIEQSRKYGFTMKPVSLSTLVSRSICVAILTLILQLIATDGPLAGQTILVLEPTATFRFMDLPPEIRNMVYGYLIDAPRENMIISYKPVHKERRSISSTFRLGTYGSVNRRRGRSGLSWDPQNGKWVAQLPLPYGLLRVSRQIQSETGSLLYGNTTFSFGEWSDMSLFLDTIGNMRRFLCRVKLPFAYKGYTKSSAIIKKLQGATSLETLLVQHEDLCSSSVKRRGHIGVHAFVAGFKHVLKAVQSSQASAGAASSGSVLDILRIEAKIGEKSMCTHCSENSQRYCPDCAGNRDHDLKCYGHINCRVPCSEHEAHCQELADEVRAELANALGIEE